jgi:hypothetical protein
MRELSSASQAVEGFQMNDIDQTEPFEGRDRKASSELKQTRECGDSSTHLLIEA